VSPQTVTDFERYNCSQDRYQDEGTPQISGQKYIVFVYCRSPPSFWRVKNTLLASSEVVVLCLENEAEECPRVIIFENSLVE